MLKINPYSILVFNCLLIISLVLAVVTTKLVLSPVALGDFTGVVYTITFIILLYSISILIYRLFLRFFPLKEGQIQPGSKLHFIYHVYLLFYLILFYILTRSKAIPVGLMRLIYLSLGAKLGDNTYCSGTILDPPLTIVGSNTILGQDCVVYAHALEGGKVSHAKIHIGNNVTVGANAVIMSGVMIEDNAIVGAGAIVTKGTTIGSKEVWGGVPAKKIKTLP
jgi:acetyltransferase-like isoleucine patch superfamily enzyme